VLLRANGSGGLYVTEFHLIVIFAIIVIFPPTLVVHLALKLALDLILNEHATEGEHARFEGAQDGETGVGERSGWCPAGHDEDEDGVEEPDEGEGVRRPDPRSRLRRGGFVFAGRRDGAGGR